MATGSLGSTLQSTEKHDMSVPTSKIFSANIKKSSIPLDSNISFLVNNGLNSNFDH